MRTPHRTNDQIRRQPRRPARCLRHHVWMAACDDCRDAHAAVVSNGKDAGAGRADEAA